MPTKVRHSTNHADVASGIWTVWITEDGRIFAMTDKKELDSTDWTELELYDTDETLPEEPQEPSEPPVEDPPAPTLPEEPVEPPVEEPEEPEEPTPPPATPIPTPPSTPIGVPASAEDIAGLSDSQIQSKISAGQRDFYTTGGGGRTFGGAVNGMRLHWVGETRDKYTFNRGVQGVELHQPKFRNETTNFPDVFLQTNGGVRILGGYAIGASDPSKADRHLPGVLRDTTRSDTTVIGMRVSGCDRGFNGANLKDVLINGYQGDAMNIYEGQYAEGCLIANSLKSDRNHDDVGQCPSAGYDDVRWKDIVYLGWTYDQNLTRYFSEDGQTPPPWPGFTAGRADPSNTQGLVGFKSPFNRITVEDCILFLNSYNGIVFRGANDCSVTNNIVQPEAPGYKKAKVQITGQNTRIEGNVATAFVDAANNGKNRVAAKLGIREQFFDEWNQNFMTLDIPNFRQYVNLEVRAKV